MNFGSKSWLSGGRVGRLARACWRVLRQGIALLEIPTPEAEQLLRRVTTMERDIFLPVKAALLAMLFYSFYHGTRLRLAFEEFSIAYEWTREWTRYFLVYDLPANVLVAAVLLAMRRLPLGLVQWVVFASGLLDTILLSALVVLTGGHQSFLYWLFLVLIVRTAVSVPRPTSQLALYCTIITCYFMAGVIHISIAKSVAEELDAQTRILDATQKEEAHRRSQRRARTGPVERAGRPAGAPTDREVPGQLENLPQRVPAELRSPPSAFTASSPNEPAKENPWFADIPAEPLLVRLTLLGLMSVCSYGVQVLFERQRKAEEEAREFAMREGQLHAAGRLAAEFAHQIKNPLAIINNAAFSLQRALKQGRSAAAEQLQMIQEEVERSDRIITQLMGYAQLSEGRVEKLDVIEELDSAIERVFPPAAAYPIQIHRDYEPHFPPLLMLRRHVSETFMNLLQNVREALGDQGGNVFVRARCFADYSIEVSIRDDGPGIPVQKRGQIFEAYYTTKPKGTGLGLATVKHNVQLYGGTVRLESELGKGACFIVVFPAKTLMKLAKQT